MNMKLSSLIATGEMKALRIALLIMAMVTAYFTYKGVALNADSFAEKGTATIFAIGSGVIVFAFWDWVFRGVQDWKSPKAKMMAGGVIGAFLLLITALSSQFNVAGVNGGQILTHHNDVQIEALSTGLGERVEAVKNIESFGADVRQGRDRYAALAETEKQAGAASGTQGVGAVYNALLSTSGRLDRLSGEIDTFIKSANAASDTARVRLDRIRIINNSGESYVERARLIKQESDLLRADFAKMNAERLREVILRTVQAMPGEIGLLEQYSRNPKTKAEQKAALERLSAEIEGTAAALEEALGAQGMAVTRPPAFQQISPTKAIRMYWSEIIPEWAGGIALDWAPLALLGLMLISLRETDADELERNGEMDNLDFKQMMLVVQAMHALNHAGEKEAVTQNMEKAAFGALMKE